MDRFEEALTGLGITDNRSKETIAPLLKSFLESSIALQRALTPINGSVHAAVSRATNHEEELMTSIDWVSVYDRVGLFDVDDRHVARLIDAALRHVWRKEESDFIIGSVGEEDNRIIAETRRAMRREGGRERRVESMVLTDERPTSQMMTMPGLRTRVSFSSVRPRVCVPTTAALSAVRALIKAVTESSHPSKLCRALGQQVFVAYQSFVIAEAGLTAETMAGAEPAVVVAAGDGEGEGAGSGSGSVAGMGSGSGAGVTMEHAGGGSGSGAGAAMEGGELAGGTEATALCTDADAAAAAAAAAAEAAVMAAGNGEGEGGAGGAGSPPAPAAAAPVGEGGEQAGGTDATAALTDAAAAAAAAAVVAAMTREGEGGAGGAGLPPAPAAAPPVAEDGGAGGGSVSGAGAAMEGGERAGGTDATAAFTDAAAAAAAAAVVAAADGAGERGAGRAGSPPAAAAAPPVGEGGEQAGGTDATAALTDAAAAAAAAAVVAAKDGDAAGAGGGSGSGPGATKESGKLAGGTDAVNAPGAAEARGTLGGSAASGKPLVLGYLVAYLRTKRLTTWRFPGKGKGPAPRGTIANPRGTVTVDKGRSLWCQRVSIMDIKPSLSVPQLAGRRHKVSNLPDEVLVVDLTAFRTKRISDTVAALLLLCTFEPEAVRIVKEVTAGCFGARPLGTRCSSCRVWRWSVSWGARARARRQRTLVAPLRRT